MAINIFEGKMTMTLAEFVNGCNKCSEDITDSSPKLDKAAKALAKGMKTGLFEDKDGKEDKDDKEFCDSLKRRGYTKSSTEYRFLQDENVVAKINPFAPLFTKVNMDNKILSQKWHVLISLLAYLDTASFDENAKMSEKFRIGKITDIELDISNKVFRVIAEKKEKCYGNRQSKLMNEWLFVYLWPSFKVIE